MPSKPYITVNKLAEYTQASATRRRQIIESLKEDVDFKKAYYQSVRAVLPKYFRSGYDNSILEKAINDVKTKSISTT